MIFLRPYGSATTVTFVVRQAGSDEFATNSHWTPASGDVKLSLDNGSQTNSTNLPTYANGQWSLSLSAGEVTAKRCRINIVDEAIISESFLIETTDHVSACYPSAYTDQWLGIPQKVTTDHGSGSYVDTGTGLTASDVRDAIGLASANLDTQLGTLAKPGDSMIASNMVNEPLDATETQQAVEDALTAYDALKVGGDVNIVSVAGSAVSSVDDFKATSVLATNMITTLDVQNAAAAANTAYGAAKPGESMVASNMVSEPLNAMEVQQAAEDALTAYDAAKGTDTMDLSPTAVQAVRSDLERSGGVLDTINDNQIGPTDVENATTSALTAYDAAKSSDIPLPDGPFIPVVSVDVSVSPWEMVFYDPTDGTTEIDRRALYEVDGTPITSVTQTVGRQLKV